MEDEDKDLKDDVVPLVEEYLSLANQATVSHNSPCPPAEVITPTKFPAKLREGRTSQSIGHFGSHIQANERKDIISNCLDLHLNERR